jgi:hypothetical protein
VYTDWAFELIARGFPLLKRRLLSHNAFGTDLSHWQARLLDVAPGAKVDAIEAQLLRTVAPDVLARGLMRRADANGRLSHR